jgi:hypothetical protein
MRNISDKIFRENQNTFYVQWLFSENRAVYEIKSKIMVESERPQMTEMTTQYGAYALYGGKRDYTRARACTRPRTRAHTHRQIFNIYCFSTVTMIRERSWLLPYTYIACLVTVLLRVVQADGCWQLIRKSVICAQSSGQTLPNRRFGGSVPVLVFIMFEMSH